MCFNAHDYWGRCNRLNKLGVSTHFVVLDVLVG